MSSTEKKSAPHPQLVLEALLALETQRRFAMQTLRRKHDQDWLALPGSPFPVHQAFGVLGYVVLAMPAAEWHSIPRKRKSCGKLKQHEVQNKLSTSCNNRANSQHLLQSRTAPCPPTCMARLKVHVEQTWSASKLASIHGCVANVTDREVYVNMQQGLVHWQPRTLPTKSWQTCPCYGVYHSNLG